MMRINSIHALVVCSPAAAMFAIKASNPTAQELAYAEALLQELKGKTDRFITAAIRNRCMKIANKIK